MTEGGKLKSVEIQFWLSEAESCIERQRLELISRNNYPFLLNYYEGVDVVDANYPHVSTQTRYCIINEYFPNTNALISELVYKNPDILLEALKPQAEEGLPIMKSALGYAFEKTDALIENRVALFDMIFAGYCAIEVDQMGIRKQAEYAQEETQDQGEGEKKSIFDQFKKKISNIMNVEEVEKKWAGLAPPAEANFSSVQGTYLRRYDPLDIPLDWRAERVKDRRYNLKKVWMSKAEFDNKYPQFSDKVVPEERKFEYSRHSLNIHNSKVLLYEFQVKLRDEKYKTIIVSPYVRTMEIDCFERPYVTNGFNIKIGTLHKYGKLYPISFAQINKKMQDEMNHYVRHMMEVAERNIPKYLTDKEKVKEDARQALRSSNVNDIVEISGNTSGAVTALQPTNVSLENKELLSIFQDQKNKLWSVSESRISGKADVDFAKELELQEEGFDASNIDIQEGLRVLIQSEIETIKDLIVTFWDGEIFLKLTGHPKMNWYEPISAPNPNNPNESMVINALTDILLPDYDVKIDIASAARPNRSQQLSKMMLFLRELVANRQILIDQGKDINVEEIQRVSKEFGWNPDKIFVQHQPAMQPTVPTAGGEMISPEENAKRQAEAEARVNAKI